MIIIAHRGASGARPEHTLAAYDLAIELGADFIEPDLVFTRDGRLVCRHDRTLSLTTNVADRPEFTDRRTSKPGFEHPDWFVEDFTLAELETLRARQPFAGRSTEWDDELGIPTFDEMLALVRRRATELHRPIGVYPETKHPSFFAGRGHDFVGPLLESLRRHRFDEPSLVFIQSFEPEILRRLRALTDAPLIRLIEGDRGEDDGGAPPFAGEALEEMASYADGVGPDKRLVYDSRIGGDTGFVGRAHDHGLAVHPWTFRVDAVGPGFSVFEDELRAVARTGIDGLFTDFPGRARQELVPG